MLSRSLTRILSCALVLGGGAVVARADDADLDHPPFDFSDAYYLQNGIDPATLVGRPDGTPPGSILDETENGPNFNDVRILELTAAFDQSGPCDTTPPATSRWLRPAGGRMRPS
jgi:hypothetical protein